MECAGCHGPLGLGNGTSGMPAPSLLSSTTQGRTDAELVTIIAEGRGAMPPFGQRYTEDAVKALVEHIRTLAAAQ